MHASARVIGPPAGAANALVPTPAGLPPAAWHYFALAREAFAEYDKAAQKT